VDVEVAKNCFNRSVTLNLTTRPCVLQSITDFSWSARMLQIEPRYDPASVVRYHRPDLLVPDEVLGISRLADDLELGREPFWSGSAAPLLGLPQGITLKTFEMLLDNVHPLTLRPLTARQKDNRICAYEFLFDVPKSVSVTYALRRDARIVGAFARSINTTMREVERHTRVRVRKDGAMGDRISGGIAYAVLIHRLTRPVNDVPEMHLHAHVIVPNVARDVEEKCWKASKFFNVKSDATYFEAVYHRSMQRELTLLGYKIRPNGKSFEIADVPAELNRAFSSRREEILDYRAKSKVEAKLGRDHAALATRQNKKEGISGEDLQAAWLDRCSTPAAREWLVAATPHPLETVEYERTRSSEIAETLKKQGVVPVDSDEDVQPLLENVAQSDVEFHEHTDAYSYSIEGASSPDFTFKAGTSLRVMVRFMAERAFSLSGAVREQDLIRHVLDASPRSGLAADEVRREIETLRFDRRTVGNHTLLVDPRARAMEKQIVERAIAGRGIKSELFSTRKGFETRPAELRHKLERLGASRDLLTVVESSATSDSILVIKYLEAMAPRGALVDVKGLVGLSPTRRQASLNPFARDGLVVICPNASGALDGLEQEGIKGAQTVGKFVSNSELRNRVVGGILAVYQAQSLATADAHRLITAAKQLDARVVLLSDRDGLSGRRPGGGVPRLLTEFAHVTTIRMGHTGKGSRPFDESLRLITDGKARLAVEDLDTKDLVRQFQTGHLAKAVASEVCQRQNSRRNRPAMPMVVTPLAKDVSSLTNAVREQLRNLGRLGPDKRVTRLTPTLQSAAERGRADFYQKGMVVEFTRNTRRTLGGVVPTSREYKAEERWTVGHITPLGVTIHNKGRTGILPIKKVENFNVYNPEKTGVAKGDRIRLTKHYKGRSGLEDIANKAIGAFKIPKRLIESGKPLEVLGITRTGSMRVTGGIVVPMNYGHWEHAYVTTPSKSMGVRRDSVILAVPEDSAKALNSRTLLAAMSAAKHRFCVLTDSVAAFKSGSQRDVRPLTATEADLGLAPRPLGTPSTSYHKRPLEDAQPKQTETERRRKQDREI
jgi:conjugative relaxase-like TrwC/TraI family protein